MDESHPMRPNARHDSCVLGALVLNPRCADTVLSANSLRHKCFPRLYPGVYRCQGPSVLTGFVVGGLPGFVRHSLLGG